MAATMRINSKSITGRRCIALLMGVAWMGMSAGCARSVDPFRNGLEPAQRVTTASVDGARAHDGTGTSITRSGPATTVAATSGAVPHFPLYYEDPTIEEGSDDGSDEWTAEDYVQFLAWQPARFLVETITWPIQAAMNPPWSVHVSDGVFARQAWDGHHDAERDRG